MRFFTKLLLTRGKDKIYRVRARSAMPLNTSTFLRMVGFSDGVEEATRANLPLDVRWIESSMSVLIAFHGHYLSQIEDGDEETAEVAQLMLLCRFANALYATARLAMMGLMLEATNQLRSALEALQLARLIHIDESFAKIYLHPEKALRPVEVRKELEKRGHDVDKARSQYSSLSITAHVGGFGESFVLEPQGKGVSFNIGGYVDPALQKRLLVDCHLAIGEYIAFHAGIRQEDVEDYHARIKGIAARTASRGAAIAEINELIQEYKSKTK